MQIIKDGIKPENVEVKKTCSRCSCEFLINKSDVQSDFRDGSYVKCPTCGTFIAANAAEFLNNPFKQ